MCTSKCKVCKYIDKSKNIIKHKNTTYPLKTNTYCKNSNVVYGIACEKCDEIKYVGETGTTLYKRIQNHLSLIRNKKMNEPIVQHFTSQGHDINDVKFVVLEQLKLDNATKKVNG